MFKEIGVEYVILEHSERRRLPGETDKIVNKKVTFGNPLAERSCRAFVFVSRTF